MDTLGPEASKLLISKMLQLNLPRRTPRYSWLHYTHTLTSNACLVSLVNKLALSSRRNPCCSANCVAPSPTNMLAVELSNTRLATDIGLEYLDNKI